MAKPTDTASAKSRSGDIHAMRPADPQPFDPMPARGPGAPSHSNPKVASLDPFREDPTDAVLTTDQGVP